MTRDEAIRHLKMLWDADTDIGTRLLVDVVSSMGYAAALTDEALITLAKRQVGEDARLGLEAETKSRLFSRFR